VNAFVLKDCIFFNINFVIWVEKNAAFVWHF